MLIYEGKLIGNTRESGNAKYITLLRFYESIALPLERTMSNLYTIRNFMQRGFGDG